MFTSVGLTLLCLALVPLYIVAVALFGVFSFLGLATGLLPLVHHCLLRRDRKRLAALLKPHEGAFIELVAVEDEEAAAAVVAAAEGAKTEQQQPKQNQQPKQPRRLAVRWSPGHDTTKPPVVLANGLGATLLTIASLHDLLEAAGFPVLSYDRAGVGMSDPLPPGGTNSKPEEEVERTVSDLKRVMDRCVPDSSTSSRPWVVVGLSMGSVVGQCLVAQHPEMVGGFVNVDGVPFPFGTKRAKFLAAGKFYCVAACASQTGLLRPLLALFGSNSSALRQAATPPRFPLSCLLAQMQGAHFFSSIAREMPLMIALCDAAAAAWGPAFDLVHLTKAEIEALANAAPAACGDVGADGVWTDVARGPVEVGDGWAAAEATKGVVARLLARAAQQHLGGGAEQQKPAATGPVTTPLWLVWQRLAVRVLSARSYDFGVASAWYDPEMQTLAAAEHSLHALLPGGEGAGQRVVFPRRSHAKMFFGLQHFILEQIEDLAELMAQRV